MEILIKDLIEQSNLNYYSITKRVKKFDSFKEKLERKHYKYQTLEEITDLAGIRIITFYTEEVEQIANLIEKEFKIDIENTIDKNKALDPDRFGYLSVHYVAQISKNRIGLPEYKNFKDCKFELQIRTLLQHTWADIEHDLGYKTKYDIPKNVQRDFYRLAGLLELADKEFLNIKHSLKKYSEHANVDVKMPNSNLLIDMVSIKSLLTGRYRISTSL